VADNFRCRLVTPEAEMLSADVSYANVPGHDGLFGIEPRRAPLLYKLGLGPLRLDFPQGGSRWYFVDGGVAHLVNETLTLLCEEAIPAEQLDLREAKAELAEAEARRAPDAATADRRTHDLDRARVKIGLARDHKGRDGAI
jgi:F-type H+-transporting ATPase subunit epsilon